MSGKRLTSLLSGVHALSRAASGQATAGRAALPFIREFVSHSTPSCMHEVGHPEWGRLANASAGCHRQQVRGIKVDMHGQEGEELSEKDYHRMADLTLGEIMVKLEALIEETPGLADSDLEYSQGVLTLNLGTHGTYVINKQGPNKQIWMSSPISGPVRYDFVEGQWVYKHDGHTFNERLANELKEISGKEELNLEPAPELAKGFVGYGADPT